MKKLIVLLFASLLTSSGTNLAHTLARSIYDGQLALKIQEDAKEYYKTGIPSPYLKSKIQLVQNLDISLSIKESVDLLFEASHLAMAA